MDPFIGTGTTGAVAKLLGRHFIGIENDKKYIAPALQRISKIKPVLNEITQLERDKKKPKILFSKIVKEGILPIGGYLYTPDKKKAKILANGQLKKGRLIGSIHQLAAVLQNKTVANGWNYWVVKIKNEYKSIDILREKK